MSRIRLALIVFGAAGSLLLGLAVSSGDAALVWNGGGGAAGPVDADGDWLGANLWWTGSAQTTWSDGNDASFGAGAGNGAAGTVTIAGTVVPNSITFNPTGNGGSYTIGGGTISLGGVTRTITANVDATIASAVTNGGLTKTGAGKLTLSGSGISYTGATTVNDGTLCLNNARSFNSSVNVADTGTLVIDSTVPFATRWHYTQTLSGSGTLVKQGDGVFDINTGGIVNFAGQIYIQEGRLMNDGGTAGGISRWSGSTADVDISAGAILDLRAADIYVDELTGSGEVWNSHNAQGTRNLFVGVADGSSTFGGIIRGTGTGPNDTSGDGAAINLVKNGSGEITLTGVNTYAGTTTINGGTLTIGGAGQLGSGTYSATISNSGSLVYSSSADQTFNGTVSGGGALTQNGPGTLTLSGANITYTGDTTVTGGTLRLTNTTAFNSSIANSGTVEINAAAAGDSWVLNVGKTLSGDGTWIKTGPGRASLRNVIVTATGSFQIQEGIVRNDYNSSNWTGSKLDMDISAGAALDLYADDIYVDSLTGAGTVQSGYGQTQTLFVGVDNGSGLFSGQIRGNGTSATNGDPERGVTNLVKSGSGIQTLSGLNTYAGTTKINGGTLQIGDGGTTGTLGAGAVTITAPGNLTFNRSDSYAVPNTIGGTGSLTQAGDGTTALSGAGITYSGATTISHGTLALQDTTGFASAIAVESGGTLRVSRTALGLANRKPIMGNAVTGSGTIDINNAGSGVDGGWTTVNGGTGSLNFSGTINVNSGVLARDNTQTDTINGTATVNVAAEAVFGAGRGGNSTIGALNGAGDVSTLWAGTSAGSLTLGNGGASGSFSGVIHGNGTDPTDGTMEGGILSLVKVGAGTQVLSGANTYAGTTTVNGGVLEFATGGSLTDSNTAAGHFSTNGGGVKVSGGDLHVYRPYFNSGSLEVTDGTFTADSYPQFGNGAGTFTWTQSGGTTNINGNNAAMNTAAGGSNVTLNFSGGTINTNGFWSTQGFGGSAASVSTLNLSGSAVFTINSGYGLYTGNGTSNFNLNGGTFALPGYYFNYNGNSTAQAVNWNFNGGTLKALGTVTIGANPQTTTTLLAGGAILDTNGYAINIGSPLTGPGGQTKLGAGTLTLSGDNSYGGDTIVRNGVVVLSSVGGTAVPGNVSFGDGSSTINPYIRVTQNNQFGPTSVVTFLNNPGGYTRFELQGTQQTLAGISDALGAGVIQNSESGVGGASVLTIDNTADYSYNGYFRNGNAGTLSLIKTGAGTQILSGPYIAHTGTTTVSQGTLALSGTTGFASATTVNDGAVLELVGAASAEHGSWTGNALTLNDGATLNKTNTGYDTINGGNVTVNGTVAINITNNGVNNQLFIGGSGGTGLTGSGAITVTNTGSATTGLTLRYGVNPSHFNGTLRVVGGALNIGTGAALTLDNADLTLDGARMTMDNSAFASGASDASLKSLTGNSTASVVLGSQTLTLGTNNGNGGVFAGTLSGAGALVKTGGGTQTLSGPNIAYTGTTRVDDCTLVLLDTVGFASNATVNADGTLQLSKTANGFGNRISVISRLISGTGTLNVDNPTPGIGGGWVIFGSSSSGLSNFTGTVNVISGVLSMDNIAGAWSGNPTLNVVSGGLFAIRAQNISVDALTGDGDVFNSWNGHGAAGDTLTVGANGGSGEFTGVIHGSVPSGGTDGAIEQGILNLVKAGAGTQILSGANTYTGTTTVNGGTLLVNGSIASNVTVNDGGRLGGNGTIGNGTNGGDVTVNGGGTVSAGNSPGHLTLNGGDYSQLALGNLLAEIGGLDQGALTDGYDWIEVLGGATLSPGAVIDVNFVGTFGPDDVKVGDQFAILTATQGIDAPDLGELTFDYSGAELTTAGTFWQASIVPWSPAGLSGQALLLSVGVPEPSTLILALLGLLGLSCVGRRRRTQ